MSGIRSYKLGAVCYILWGLLHVAVGGLLLYTLWSSGGGAALMALSAPFATETPPPLATEIVSGVLGQHAWNLLWIGIFAVAVGAAMNWRNSQTGYWLNLGVISAADIGFIVAMVIPGHVSGALGLLGPILWLLGLVFSTVGIREARPG